MRAVDLIAKKQAGKALSGDELYFLVNGLLTGSIPDYQMSAWLMAVYFRGMTDEETFSLTQVMLDSGAKVDLSRFSAETVDKHSTGGVGDKISLVLAPLLASAGLVVGKLTGRGLGHTGGTVDKLESIPGFHTDLTMEQYFSGLTQIGLSMISAGPDLVPADKRLYALRDVTSTVKCLPLIASSIMSKKLAGGAKHIVLDVKCGRGAFLTDLEEASELARLMLAIGRTAGRSVRVVISDMSQPLGLAVGNNLEVQEAIAVLRGGGPADVRELTIALGSELLQSASELSLTEAEQQLRQLLVSGAAWDKFLQFVQLQGGDEQFVLQPATFPRAAESIRLVAERTGYLADIDAELIGRVAMICGAGRARKEDAIDYSAGVLLQQKRGAYVASGDALAILYASDRLKLDEAVKMMRAAWSWADVPVPEQPLILSRMR